MTRSRGQISRSGSLRPRHADAGRTPVGGRVILQRSSGLAPLDRFILGAIRWVDSLAVSGGWNAAQIVCSPGDRRRPRDSSYVRASGTNAEERPDVQQGHRADSVPQLRGVPSAEPGRADVAAVVSGCAAVGEGDQDQGRRARDAALVRRSALRQVRERQEPDAGGDRDDRAPGPMRARRRAPARRRRCRHLPRPAGAIRRDAIRISSSSCRSNGRSPPTARCRISISIRRCRSRKRGSSAPRRCCPATSRRRITSRLPS